MVSASLGLNTKPYSIRFCRVYVSIVENQYRTWPTQLDIERHFHSQKERIIWNTLFTVDATSLNQHPYQSLNNYVFTDPQFTALAKPLQQQLVCEKCPAICCCRSPLNEWMHEVNPVDRSCHPFSMFG